MNTAVQEQMEILQDFLIEMHDLLEELEPSILGLEGKCGETGGSFSEEERETLNKIFRLFHSLKGAS